MFSFGQGVVLRTVLTLAVAAAGWLPSLAAQETQEPADESAAAPSAAPETAPEPAPSEPAAAAAVDTIPVPDSAAAAAEPEAASTELDAITVTARKREESLQEVPLSVTAYNADDMDRRGFSGLEDLARATPGFTFEPYMTGGAHAAPVIRGLAQTFTTARIQNVSFFLDGVYLQRQSMLDMGMVDLERIEIMKGPQNALYGRNAFAGAVNYVTLVPANHPEGYLQLGLGDNDRRKFRVGVTGPLNEEGSVYGKLTLGRSSYEGHTTNNHPVANANPPGENLRGNLGGHEDETYSLSLVWEALPELKLRGNYYFSDLVHETGPGYSISGVHAARFDLRFDDQNDLNCLPGTVPDIGNPSVTHTGNSAWCGELPKYASDANFRRVNGMVVDPRAIGSTSKTGLVTFMADYELSDAISLYYLYGNATHDSYTDGGASDEDPVAGRGIYVDASKDTQDETAYVFANTASGRPNSQLDEYSHELRMDWEFNDRLRFGAGGYYSKVRDQEWTSLYISDLCNRDTPENIANCNSFIGSPNHIAEQSVLTVGVAYDQYVRQHGGKLRGEWSAFEDSVSALFSSASYEITDTIEATAELRYSVEKKVIDRITDAQMLRDGEQVMYAQPEDPVIPGLADTMTDTIAIAHDEATFKDVTPRGIVTWDWSPVNMVYVSGAKGVKAGGFNNSGVVTEQEYEPETNWTYELGSKNRLFGFVTLNASLYYIDWTALQGQSPPTNVTLSSSDVVDNIGGAKSTGLEIEGAAFVTKALSLDMGVSLSNPRYDDGVVFRAAGPDPDGNAQKIFCDDVICPADGSIGGNQLARTSRKQYSAGVNYVQDLAGWTLTGRLDTNYQSKQFIEPVNLSWVPERQITNASLKINLPNYHWEINTWVKNLADVDYPSNSFYIGVFDQYMVGKGAPRTFGATLKYKF